MATDHDRRQDWEDAYDYAQAAWGDFLTEAEKDLKFYLGDQWSAADKAYLLEQRRAALVWNKIRRVVHLIGGYQRKNRLAMKVDPVENSDEKTASQFSGLLQWIMQSGGAYNVMSDCFSAGPVKTGLSLLSLSMDYTDDPVSGDIRFRRSPYNRFLLDPDIQERDLSDCKFLLRREMLPKTACKALLPPDRAKAVEGLKGGSGSQDNKFVQFSVPHSPYKDDLLRYDEFWRRDWREIKVLLDTKTGDWRKWRGPEDRLRALLAQFPTLKVLSRMEKSVSLTVLVEEEIMYDGPDPMGLGDYPFVPLFGYWDPEFPDWRFKLQGVVRCMRDPQTELNRRRSQLIDMIDTQINSGWKAEEGSVANPAALYQGGQGKTVWTKANKFGLVEKIIPGDIPPGVFQFSEALDNDIMEIPGANSEMFGMPESDSLQIAGFLAKLRQGQGLTVLQEPFDNLRMVHRLIGNKLIKAVQQNWEPAKVQAVINEPPSQEFYDRDFGKYDAVPVEGLLSDTQRQQYFTQLMAMKEMGAPIPWTEIIDVAPVERKESLTRAMQAAEKAQAQGQQLQQKMIELEMAAKQAKIDSDKGNAVEQQSQAFENRASAILDQIKTVKELQGMDNQQILDGLKFIAGMRGAGQGRMNSPA